MSSEEKITNVVQRYAQPVNIKLSRSSKGSYYWSIDVRAEDVDQALYMLEEADQKLRVSYLEQPTLNQPGPDKSPDKPENPHSRMNIQLNRIHEAGEKPVNLWEAGK